MSRTLLSLLIWTGAGMLTVLLWVGSLCTVLLTGWWDADRRLAHLWARGWAWAVVKMNPFWTLTVDDQAHLDPRRPYVFVMNHQSFADVAVLPFIRVPYKCLSKSALFWLPFFGWSLGLHRHIRLRRGAVHGIQRAMEEARTWLRRGMPVAFFAEGTRSRTGELRPFKSGAFKLAIETKTPVVPLAITGTREALPRGSWVFRHRVHGTLTILPPVDTATLQVSDTNALTQDVFRSIQRIVTQSSDRDA